MWDTAMKMILAFLEEKRPESSGGVDSPGLCSPSCLLWSPVWLASSVTASPSSPQHPSRSLHKRSREEIRSCGGKKGSKTRKNTRTPCQQLSEAESRDLFTVEAAAVKENYTFVQSKLLNVAKKKRERETKIQEHFKILMFYVNKSQH